MEIKLEVKEITKRFGELVAVDNVSFSVFEGEMFSILGPSGCGKTTTLRIISGLEKPDKGRVFISGKDVTFIPPKERGVCLVFQEYAVFPHMTTYDNLAFGLKIKHVSPLEEKKLVNEIADILGLRGVLNKKAGRLSLGEKQRIALGRCIVLNPEILLLDEPLTLADAKIRETMRRELRRIQKELKITLLYVTHDQLEAMMLSDRIAVMNKGRILQIGTPSEIYDNPRNLFVAFFIGSPTINLYEGVLVRKNDKYILDIKGESVDFTKVFSRIPGIESLLGRKIVVGIRPEDVLIVSEEKKGHLAGFLELTEISGDQLFGHVRINKNILIRGRLESPIEQGRVGVFLDLEKIHLFDAESTERLSLGEGG